MRAEQANAIDLSLILRTINSLPMRQTGASYWYNSPFRNEKTPSFHVDLHKNVWFDFGDGRGGTVIDFVCAWLECQGEDHTVVDALRWLDNMQTAPSLEMHSKEDLVNYGVTLDLKKVGALQNPAFINYLHTRGIPLACARKYLREANVYNKNTGRTFSALAFPNENGGFELRNKFFKGCIAPKGISFIRGKTVLPDTLHVFEGFMDFLSALVHQKSSRFDGDAIILNSTACLKEAFPYIRNYSYKTLYSWLDNDAAGQKATLALHELAVKDGNFIVKPMNELYAPHNDVNTWHMAKLELKPR